MFGFRIAWRRALLAGLRVVMLFGIQCMLLEGARAQPMGPSSRAAGSTAKEPILIDYSADPGCPPVEVFHRLVFERTVSARLAFDSEEARVFVAKLRRRGSQYTGSLVIREPNGTSVARRVSGKNCNEVATVLALASALAIDPHAELAPGQTLESGNEPETDASGTMSSGQESFTTYGAEDTGAEHSHAFVKEGPTTELGVALGGRGAMGIGPRPSLGASLLLGAFPKGEPVRMIWGIEFTFLQTLTATVKEASAEFQFLTARPQICPLRLADATSGSLSLCAIMELGLVRGRGGNLPFSDDPQRFWAAPELALRWDQALSSLWFTQFDVGAAVPLTRYRFVFENPETSVHDVPIVTAGAALRIGIRH